MARCDSSFVAVPYRTPSASPDRSAIHSKPAMTAVVAAPPAPTTVHNAAPPSPPLGPISALALFAAEMFVWLWFAPTSGGAGVGEAATPEDGAGLARLQVKPTDRFLRFCHEVLSTTQVSHSVVLLALLFVSRLKQRNDIKGAAGSEYRLAVTALMLGNKILDDNTYTAQTWSQVSSLELKPLVAGEAEFLRGLDWSLHVTKRDFDAWLKLLEGHVAARNARLGKIPAPSNGIATPSRRRSTKRLSASRLSPDLHALRASAAIPPHLQASTTDPFLTTEEARRVKPRLMAPASTNTTPRLAFADYSLAPPYPPPFQLHASAPLPVYSIPAPSRDPPRPPLDLSPTTTSSQKRNSGFRASASHASGVKRSADDAFGQDQQHPAYVASALPPYVQAQVHGGQMTRSWSAGPTAAPGSVTAAQDTLQASSSATRPLLQALSSSPTRDLFSHHVTPVPWATTPTPYASRPSSSSSAAAHLPPLQLFAPPIPTGFSTLSDSFSPHYDPEQHRRLRQGSVSLNYYALAAGQGLGHLRQTLPPPTLPVYPFVSGANAQQAYPYPYGYAPLYPLSVSTSTSPLSAGASSNHRYPSYPTPTSATATNPTSSAMAPSSSMHTSSDSRRLSGMSASSPPGWVPPLPLPSAATAPAYPYIPPPPATYGYPPHPYWSAYSNAGVPGVYWQGP
ncbi:hypothetical protein NBRC10512_006622 [Rhodotorula toruloides]|uniref:RHTO0S10e04478g1_1 n=2 Tax=Rhodotorula toruloides TaxID=5286 RepID=A0A061BDN0_RHOTO|nr:protein of Cyclin PHO80-like family [Rhodotorula toruloides NP11]EMS22803.1 protein of Cyclin PHO80-like family [Rhodotorula toruloides NP11]CDR45044.1 RHTO0S10e04478g1_1 [Rhodotorula toruloides]